MTDSKPVIGQTMKPRYPAQIVVQVSEETKKQIEYAALEQGKSRSEVIRDLIDAGVAAGGLKEVG